MTDLCLWGSRNGRTPTKKWWHGKYACTLPSRSHMYGPDATPHRFEREPSPPFTWRTALSMLLGVVVGDLVAWLLVLPALGVLR